MALISCPQCGGQVSNQATNCPHCGAGLPAAAYGPQPYGPQQPYGQQPYGPQPVYNSGKSKNVAGLLCFFLGGLGIHYFYMGKSTMGIIFLLINILLNVVTFGFYSFLLGVYLLICSIRMWAGSQQEFDNHWVNPAVKYPL